MQIQIPEITLNAFEIFGDEKQEAELDRQENAVKSVWTAIYNAVKTGEINIAYWNAHHVTRPGYDGFMQYALHRSAKQDGLLQLSTMEICNGEIIPTSDSQYGSAEDFISRRAWSFGAETVMIM